MRIPLTSANLLCGACANAVLFRKAVAHSANNIVLMIFTRPPRLALVDRSSQELVPCTLRTLHRIESPRVFQRLRILRGWSHGNDEEVSGGSPERAVRMVMPAPSNVRDQRPRNKGR